MSESFHSFPRSLLRLACVLAVLGFAVAVHGQQEGSSAPYASIGSKGVSYAGPGRQSAFDLPGPVIRIGLLAPLHGPQKADGDAIVAAAQMALREESRRPLPGGLRLALDVEDESVPPWGPLGDEIIHLVLQQKVIAMVTCADGVTAHLSEQIGNKIGVPTLTLSTDATTTQIDLPWIFRMGPSDVLQAQVFAGNIYQARGLRRVLLVSGSNHDGRIGSQEFIKAVRRLGAPAPDSLVINPLDPSVHSLRAAIEAKSPQAIVFWTQPENAGKLLHAIREDRVQVPVYLSQEAAQQGSGMTFAGGAAESDPPGAGVYAVASSKAGTPLCESFARRFQSATGAFPSPVAAEAYDAVRLIARALREAGPNRARVRDQIAGDRDLAGASGTITFDDQGNNRAGVRLVPLQ